MLLKTLRFAGVASATALTIAACSAAEVGGPGNSVIASTPDGGSQPAPRVNPVLRSFIWTEEAGLRMIPLPSGATSIVATALNNSGQVVGYFNRQEGIESYTAFLWSERDGFRSLGSLTGPDGLSIAFSIDDSAVVKGISAGPNGREGGMGYNFGDGFTWTARDGMKGEPLVIGFPGFTLASEGGRLQAPDGTNCSQIVTVNDVGQAIGYAGLRQQDGNCKPKVAVMWQKNGSPIEIDQCSGADPWCSTSLKDINNNGEVAGYSAAGGFKWTAPGGRITCPIDHCGPQFISDDGNVGLAVGSGNTLAAAVWLASGSVITIDTRDKSTYAFPVAMNASGMVVGNLVTR